MSFFALPNLSAQIVMPCKPWEWTNPAPERCILDKIARDQWATNPNTKHECYSAFEALNSSLRASEQNPPLRIHAIVGDYDLKIGQAEMESALARLTLKPNWLEQTLSGHWRALWLLERPIPLACIAHTRHLLQHVSALVPVDEIPGLDRPALQSFSRYWTNSGVWKKVHDTPIAWDSILGWLMKSSSTFGWSSEMPGHEIDFKILADRLREKFPRFSEWPGEFALGSYGPSFWVEGSTSPKSAIVREKGIHTFAAHAPKAYFSWADLCGEAWMQAFQTNRIGGAVKDIYFDDKNFFVLSPTTEQWLSESKEGLLNELLVARGLRRESGKKSTGKPHSEIEEAVNYIRHHQRVAGAAPFAFFKKGLLEWNGGRYLNTHTREVLRPAKTGEWGTDFPFVSSFLEQFFIDGAALPFWISWLSRSYRCCFHRKPVSGQSVFLSGPVNVGKTFLSRGILSPLLGGHAEPKDFLLGSTTFNSQLFEYMLWVIDDGSIGTSAQVYRYFCEMVKNQAANRDSVSHAKFGKPSQVACMARLIVTCNDDAESRRIIPRVDISILEKLMLFRAAPRSISFPDSEEMERIKERELPSFARFLLDYEIPEKCKDPDPRFGVISYHDPELVASANTSDSAFTEILDHWMTEHFQKHDPTAEFWEGSALQFQHLLLADSAMAETLHSYNLEEIKRRLLKLSSGTLFRIEMKGDARRMNFRIYRGEHLPRQMAPPIEINPSANSKFSKI